MDEVIQIGARVPEPLSKRFKVALAQNGDTAQSVLSEAIERYVASRETPVTQEELEHQAS